MMVWAINMLVLSIGILIVGMIKPNWILFWMDKPIRMPIVVLSAVLFMVFAVMFGEATKEKQQESNNSVQQLNESKGDVTPTVEAADLTKVEK